MELCLPFSVKIPNIPENRVKTHLRPFSYKGDENRRSRKTYWLKLEFYNTDRKKENITRRISI